MKYSTQIQIIYTHLYRLDKKKKKLEIVSYLCIKCIFILKEKRKEKIK